MPSFIYAAKKNLVHNGVSLNKQRTIREAGVIRDDAGDARLPGVSSGGRDARVALEAGRVILAVPTLGLAVFGLRRRRAVLRGDHPVGREEGGRRGDGEEQRWSSGPAASAM